MCIKACERFEVGAKVLVDWGEDKKTGEPVMHPARIEQIAGELFSRTCSI